MFLFNILPKIQVGTVTLLSLFLSYNLSLFFFVSFYKLTFLFDLLRLSLLFRSYFSTFQIFVSFQPSSIFFAIRYHTRQYVFHHFHSLFPITQSSASANHSKHLTFQNEKERVLEAQERKEGDISFVTIYFLSSIHLHSFFKHYLPASNTVLSYSGDSYFESKHNVSI